MRITWPVVQNGLWWSPSASLLMVIRSSLVYKTSLCYGIIVNKVLFTWCDTNDRKSSNNQVGFIKLRSLFVIPKGHL